MIRRRLSRFAFFALGLAFCLMAVACGAGVGQPLPDALSKIPMYPGAKVEHSMGMTEASFEGGDLQKDYSDMTWQLTTRASIDKVIAFYEKELPQAKKVIVKKGETLPPDPEDPEASAGVADQDSATFIYTPTGFAQDEAVEITIAPGQIWINERVKHSRRP